MVIAIAPAERATDRRSRAGERFERPIDRADLLRARRDRVRYLDVPSIWFAMVDGAGASTPEVLEPRISVLYPVAYGLHFALKRRGVRVRVGPLEGLYWTSTDERPLDARDADRSWWRWTLMLALPDEATEGEIATALDDARRKRPDPLFDALRVERFVEGPSAQILHVGPYAAEGPTIERLAASIAADGLRACGRHHEVYLGDPHRSRPERLRTILRQPVEPATGP